MVHPIMDQALSGFKPYPPRNGFEKTLDLITEREQLHALQAKAHKEQTNTHEVFHLILDSALATELKQIEPLLNKKHGDGLK